MVRKNSDMPKTANTPKKGTRKYSVLVNGSKYEVALNGDEVSVNGNKYEVAVGVGENNYPQIKKVEAPKAESKSEAPKAVSSGNGNEIEATLPSNVFKIVVKEGEHVKAGQTVVILEAMKMEINIESPRDGVIAEILVKQGETVDSGQVLARLQ